LATLYGWFGLPREHGGIVNNTAVLENAWRAANNGYRDCADGSGACCVRWDANPGSLGWQWRPNPRGGCMAEDVAQAILASLVGERPVLAAVHALGEPAWSHWAVVVGVANGELLVADPWGGEVVPLSKGKKGAYTVEGVLVPLFSGTGATGVIDAAGKPVDAAALPGGQPGIGPYTGAGGFALPKAPVPSQASGGCSAQGQSTTPLWILGLVGLLGLAVARRRRRSV